MGAVYQVVAECAHATVSGPTGRATTLLLKGALVPADAPELERLLREGYVAKVGDDATGGVDATGRPSGAYEVKVPAAITSTPVERTEEQRKADDEAAEKAKAAAGKAKADAEADKKRADAKAKLPEGGAMPDGRQGQPVWVEYLVSKGSNYDDVKDVDKDELVRLAKQQS
jgi:hypothetical protein